jgi:hypothetical protein
MARNSSIAITQRITTAAPVKLDYYFMHTAGRATAASSEDSACSSSLQLCGQQPSAQQHYQHGKQQLHNMSGV